MTAPATPASPHSRMVCGTALAGGDATTFAAATLLGATTFAVACGLAWAFAAAFAAGLCAAFAGVCFAAALAGACDLAWDFAAAFGAGLWVLAFAACFAATRAFAALGRAAGALRAGAFLACLRAVLLKMGASVWGAE